MATRKELLLKACQDSWTKEWVKGKQNKDNCSGFVKAVCYALCVPMEDGIADTIVGYIDDNWTEVADGAEAQRLAEQGTLVLAGLESDDHTPARTQGHVVVVVPGDLYRGKYPKCWGGSTGTAQSQGTKSVGEVWNRTDRDAVIYRAHTFSDSCSPAAGK